MLACKHEFEYSFHQTGFVDYGGTIIGGLHRCIKCNFCGKLRWKIQKPYHIARRFNQTLSDTDFMKFTYDHWESDEYVILLDGPIGQTLHKSDAAIITRWLNDNHSELFSKMSIKLNAKFDSDQSESWY